MLLDDRFGTIGAAIEQGRVIFDNIRKFVFCLFSCNLAEVLVLLVAALVGLPLPLLPLQILWLNIVTDTFPALSLAVEPADRDVMRRRPRDPDEAIFSAGFLRAITWYALLITTVTLGAFWFEGSSKCPLFTSGRWRKCLGQNRWALGTGLSACCWLWYPRSSGRPHAGSLPSAVQGLPRRLATYSTAAFNVASLG